MSKQSPPPPTASTVGPCSTIIQIGRMPWRWKFTQNHPTTGHVVRLTDSPNMTLDVYRVRKTAIQQDPSYSQINMVLV